MNTRAAGSGVLGVLVVLNGFLSAVTALEHATYVVDRLTDANPTGGGEWSGSGLAGDLRYGLINAQSGDSVTFDVSGTIQLASGLPTLNQNITIVGPGANSLTVHGGRFSVGSGATVVFSGLTITGGYGNGGGIFNRGTLTLNGVTVSGGVAGDQMNGGGTGAGIWNYIDATLTLNDSTVSGNAAAGNASYNPSRGGGIANYGTLTLNNSTVSGNVASQGFGGGISNALTSSLLTLNHSTISGNGAWQAGGIANYGTVIARNSIIAGNTGGDLTGVVTSQGHNLIGTGGSGFDATDLVNADPMLGPLQDNGGTTATVAPWPDSPAVDSIAGTAEVDFPASDQRGMLRPQGSLADIGAIEVMPFSGALDTTATAMGATATVGRTVALKGTLAQRGWPLSNRTLSFMVDSLAAGNGTTNASGTATVYFPITESIGAGTHTITVSFSGNNYFNDSSGTNTFQVTKANTSLTVPAKTAKIGSNGVPVTFEATLKRSGDSAAVSGRPVDFRMDGNPIGTAMTNGNGLASLIHTVPATTTLGSHTTTATFAGDSLYNASSRSGSLRVLSATTVLVLNQNGARGTSVTLTAMLTRDTDGTPIAGATVKFQVDSTTVGTGTTDPSGLASFVYSIPSTTSAGVRTISGTYNGSTIYASSTGKGTLSVN